MRDKGKLRLRSPITLAWREADGDGYEMAVGFRWPIVRVIVVRAMVTVTEEDVSVRRVTTPAQFIGMFGAPGAGLAAATAAMSVEETVAVVRKG